MKQVYDFAFLGSGMGALVCANILSKYGYKVVLLEKNQQFGGSLQSFSRDKRIFDTGVHYIGSLDKGQTLNKVFKYLNVLEHLKLQRLDHDTFDLIRFPNGITFRLGQGYDNFKSSLLEIFPEEEEAIDTFCSTIKEICELFPLFNLKSGARRSIAHWPNILNIGAYEYLCTITSNKELIAALLGNGPLYAGERGITPLYVTALILDSFLNGSYRIKGGGSQLTKILCRNIRSLGGELIKRANVINIEVEEKEVKYYELDDGRKIYAKTYISNIHPHKTNELIGFENLRPAYKNRIENLENTISSFTLYLSFKEKSFPYLNYNIYDYFVEPENVWDITSYDKDTWPDAIFSCTATNINQGEFSDTLTVLTYMDYKEVKSWSDSFNTAANPGERSDAYNEFKKKKEEQVLNRLENRFPGIRECILNQHSSTPLTYKDYIGTDDGSLYGIKKDFNSSAASSINSKTKIKNMYLTGQNIVFHGILGATISGLLTCMNFIDGDQLIEDIANE
jgi:all-trans-retinol 13,14-reductase